MYTVESKSLLAKLMATENITVEHDSKARTASFNIKTRVLICPIWREMTGDLYDLLMGHEISHALRTPLDGWHDSVIYAGGNKRASAKEQKAFKHFLNVVEDARIERLVKRQYPGLRAPMVKGYQDLLKRDFFGLSAISDFNSLYLIDKLNLAAKVGSMLNIRFTAKEKPFYDRLMVLETFEEVLALTKDLFTYSKDEQKEGEKEKQKIKEGIDKEQDEQEREEWETDDFGDDEGEESEGEESEGEESEGEESEGEESEEGDESDADEQKQSEKDANEENEKKETTKRSSDSKGTDGNSQDTNEDFLPKAATDENYRKKETELVDKNDVNSITLNIPTPNLKDAVTPAAIVNRGLSSYYSAYKVEGLQLLQDFKKKNEDYVALMAKEFEMKKAARSYNKSKQADSGDININKLASYRTEDNIFKRVTIAYKGKSHGLVLLLDRSSSMRNSVEAATEQILILALFCRKVNIPFVAYTFTNNSGSSQMYDFSKRMGPLHPFSTGDREFACNGIGFREILNSTMGPADFNNSMMYQLLLAVELGESKPYVYGQVERGIPSQENMGSTPLNEALVILRDVLRQFRMKHRLDIVNAIVVHDGDSDGNSFFNTDAHKVPMDSYGAAKYSRSQIPTDQWFDTQRDRVTITDKKEKVSVVCPREYRGLQIALMKWVQATTGSGVFGFYITGKPKNAHMALEKLYVNELGIPLGNLGKYTPKSDARMILLSALTTKLTVEKFVESWSEGYSRMYFIPGERELAVDNGQMVNPGGSKWTPSRLLNAFKKVNKKRAVSRVLVRRFIELLAV